MFDEQTAAVPGAQVLFHQRFSTDGQEFSHRIRRCFMTGKQCIFYGRSSADKVAQEIQRPRSLEEARPVSVFVIMPFRPNLNAFYDWSLRRYLRDSLDIREPKEQIHRADDFCEIGYVMCEKICRRIQEADLVVVDLSVENPNAMYELGLAIGLFKPILAMCNERDADRLDKDFIHSIGLQVGNLLKYPSLGYIHHESKKVIDCATRVPLTPRKATMSIVPLVIPENRLLENEPSECSEQEKAARDMTIDFRESLRAAVGVAIADINENIKSKSPDLREAWAILGDENIRKMGTLTKDDDIPLLRDDGKPKTFEDVTKGVDSAFTCIVDLAGENPHSYFWLGYCHARGINAIPIYRDLPDRSKGNQGPGRPVDVATANRGKGAADDENTQHVIAFDIRALWYIQFKPDKVPLLAGSIGSALEELIAKDIPRLQRNIFWERLTRHPMVHIYTGAVHHEGLEREVVGDWDQRTVSELVRYLSSAEESVVPELERPIYSPGTIKSKLNGDWLDPDSMDAYVNLVKSELQDKNCVIVASADVNPLTEVVLAYAYGVFNTCFKSSVDGPALPLPIQRRVVVALKGWKDKAKEKVAAASDSRRDDGIPTFFSRSGHKEGIREHYRGFWIDGRVIEREYKSQDEAEEEPFKLLSHLVVMKNPFSSRNQDTLIVLLNGVSGPGTFALAEVLTGGRSTVKAADSEKLLAEFNRLWGEAEAEARRIEKLPGIEGIIQVTIQPKKRDNAADYRTRLDATLRTAQDDDSPAEKKPRQTVDDKFFDKREVLAWDFIQGADEQLAGGNPRSFYFESRAKTRLS